MFLKSALLFSLFPKIKQSEIIAYYNYTPEVHKVTTTKGCILTIVRCNTKKACPCYKRVVILQHGLLGSSDDYTVNPPDQALGEKEWINYCL